WLTLRGCAGSAAGGTPERIAVQPRRGSERVRYSIRRWSMERSVRHTTTDRDLRQQSDLQHSRCRFIRNLLDAECILAARCRNRDNAEHSRNHVQQLAKYGYRSRG